MQQIPLSALLDRAAALLREGRAAEARVMLSPAVTQYPDHPALWFYFGFACHMVGDYGVAALAWGRSYDLEPQAQVLTNLGAATREGRPVAARAILRKAMRLQPGEIGNVINLLGCYVNEGDPVAGLRVIEEHPEALDHPQARFNAGLLALEAGDFGRGFRWYATGQHECRESRTYEGAEPLRAENFEAARGSRLIVYGEQGIGDELMFGTMLADVVRDFTVIYDHHPRLTELVGSAPWADRVERHATRKGEASWYRSGMADYAVPIGNLGQWYRSTREAFVWHGPVYRASADEAATNRRYLEALAAGRRIIGLALRGGTLKTARTYRSLDVPVLDRWWRRDDVLWVLLDYDDMSPVIREITERYGPGRVVWYPSISWAWDYARMAALVAATDAVVSVCQSVAHLSAAMGHRTCVLTPQRPAWRYGVGSTSVWYWYPAGHATLHRQRGVSWNEAMSEIEQCLL